MELTFQVNGRVSRPVAEVFEAVVNPDTLSKYFTTGGAKGRLETGATVYWDFHDYPGAFPVKVVEVVKDRKIVFEWEAEDKAATYDTRVTMTFEPLEDDRTLVSIKEEGFRETETGLQASYLNCGGWMQVLCAMKAYVEHGINLREGMFK